MLAPPPLPRNLDASFRDLDSEKPDVRASAIEDLTRHARAEADVRRRAIPLLEKRLADATPKVRAAAAVALADLEAEDAVPALLRNVDDDDAYVRQMALVALGEIGDDRALPRLCRAVSDKRPEMRYQAIIALARVSKDDDDIERQLLAATKDDDEAVQHIALRIAEERLDAGRRPEVKILARARQLLESPSTHLAIVAAILLGKAGDVAGKDLVLKVVRGEKIRGHAVEKEDERAAVELAGTMGLEEARSHLERRAWGMLRHLKDTCSFHAKIALASMRHPRALAEIMADLDAERPDVKSAAVVAAGRGNVREALPKIERISDGVDPELVDAALARLRA